MHYDLMEGNLGDVEACVRLAPEVHPGGRVTVLARMADTPLHTLVAPENGADGGDRTR